MPVKADKSSGFATDAVTTAAATAATNCTATSAAESKGKNWTQNHYTASRTWNQGAPDAKGLCTNVLFAETPTAQSQSP